MSKRSRGRYEEEAIANASDPEDGDWGGDSPPARPTARRGYKKSSRSRPRKRARQTRDDSDIEEDDGDEISEESFSESSEDEPEEAELNPATGRPLRNVTRKSVNYEESEEDEIEDSDTEKVKRAPSSRPPTRGSGSAKLKLIVKLPVAMRSPPQGERRLRRGSRALHSGPTSPNQTNRRSSRLSHDESEAIYQLTNSGRHAVVAREGTRSPSAEPSRPIRITQGGKGVKKMPSAIIEASQETSGPSQHVTNQEEDDSEEGQGFIAESPSPSAPEADEDEDEYKGQGAAKRRAVQGSDDEDDEGPVARRSLRSRDSMVAPAPVTTPPRTRNKRSRAPDESSDFNPGAEEEEQADEDMMSGSNAGSPARKRRQSQEGSEDSSGARRSRRLAGRSRNSQQGIGSGQESELDQDELAEEADMLAEEAHQKRSRRSRRTRGIVYDDQPKLRSRGPKPDYRVFRPELAHQQEEDDAPAQATPQKRGRGANGAYRSLFSIQGPFGGALNLPPGFGGAPATGGVDSDSSDDDMQQRAAKGIGGGVGMTPTSAVPPSGLLSNNPDQLPPGAPANHGKVKDKRLLADADPLGVDQNVTFEGVGGLDGHIDQLKEMVALPLLYPEVFQRFHVTPPRGVLFHGPPGTGKTLLARALASSVSTEGQKVTFYMRKGADALSKWVGEAEKQLRLLFEEARKTQPSIIFFDEIDGLAPVRSSKQEQIHASIVATLLALMDGMDGRGQVIVIGATNRPDSVDPALRRPGRFDREFYFPLPNVKARRSIIDIHTKGWDPPLQPRFKDSLADLTKGYGGADLRALCTEAALNAVQGTFPQIYASDKKLLIDPSKIKVLAKDFMISVNKMVPSSERAASSGAAPLSKEIEPLLRRPMQEISTMLDELIPQKKKLTPLEEAQYDDRNDDRGFEREILAQSFERARVFRPRMLIQGMQGMGQAYLGPALLNRFEMLHVQSFDLPSLLEDSTRSPEATVIQFFKEVRRHKPSVIFIPNVDIWYQAVGPQVIKTFTSLLRSLPPNDAVLLLGVLEKNTPEEKLDPDMLRDLFGYSQRNQYVLPRPDEDARYEYFENVISYVRMSPTDFPTAENRIKRKLPDLPLAPLPQAKSGPSKEEIKAQRKKDRLTLNILRIHLQPIMDQIKLKHRKFRTPVIEEYLYSYLFDDRNPGVLSTDLTEEQRLAQQFIRPFELAEDKKGVSGLREVATGNFYYNVDTVMIERRLSNGYYKRGKDFLADIKRLVADSKMIQDEERLLKANELLSTVEVDLETMGHTYRQLFDECEALYHREQQREKDEAKKRQREAAAAGQAFPTIISNVPPEISGTATESTGPIVLGEPVPGASTLPPVTPIRRVTDGSELSNGVSVPSDAALSNGHTIPSRQGEDVTMADVDDISLVPATQNPAADDAVLHSPSMTQPSQVRPSQEGPHTQVGKDLKPADYHNSASTTTSGQKTERSSGGGGGFSTQSTNGHNSNGYTQHPDLASIHQPMSGGSQLPDTQATSSQSSSSQQRQSAAGTAPSSDPFGAVQPDSQQAQQQPTSDPKSVAGLPGILNSKDAAPTAGGSKSSSENTQSSPFAVPHPPLTLDNDFLSELHRALTQRSSGLSVEQLEQVNAALMDAVWKHRSQWSRNVVVKEVQKAFNAVVEDVESMQRILPPSQPKAWRRDSEGD